MESPMEEDIMKETAEYQLKKIGAQLMIEGVIDLKMEIISF